MSPLKKSKKGSKMKKLKRKKALNVVPIDPRAVESNWWDTFWQRNSSIPGSTIPKDEEEGFRYFFRMSKNTFEYICSLVRENLISRPPSGLINIEGRLLSVEKQVAIALRRLASGESQVLIGASFGVGQSTVSQITWRFVEALEERAKHHLRWPNHDRMEEIKSEFETCFGLPNCCGAIDATHIAMTLPAVETSDDWSDEASNYSMLVQGIVDHEMRFIDLVTGWPGRMSCSKALKFSGVYKLSESGNRLNGESKVLSGGIEVREYIVGRSNYPLLPWLITPYQGDHGLLESVSKFRHAHEAARSLATKAFAQMKGTWRIISKPMWRPDKRKLPSIILVCCLLQNIMIDCGDRLCAEIALPHHDMDYEEQFCNEVDRLGSTMRENLSRHLHCLE